MRLQWWSHLCHHTWWDFDYVTVIILDETLIMKMSSLSSYSMRLWWWSHHCHHTWYDYDKDVITFIILDMTLMMMISSLSLYSIWLWWWSHNRHYTRCDFDDDDVITVTILDVTMMMMIMISYSIWPWWWSHHFQYDLMMISLLSVYLIWCHHYTLYIFASHHYIPCHPSLWLLTHVYYSGFSSTVPLVQ